MGKTYWHYMGRTLNFNSSLCTDAPNLQKSEEIFYVTRYSNYAIISSEMLLKKLQQLSFIRKKPYNTRKETFLFNELTKVCEEIKMKTVLQSSLVLQRHKRKYQREYITIFTHQRKNRKFRKSKRKRHNNERKIKHRENKGELLKKPKSRTECY